MGKLQARQAEINDIEGILAVQAENLVPINTDSATKANSAANNDQSLPDVLPLDGFLIYPTNAKELRDLILDTANVRVTVLSDGEEIVGYALAYDVNIWKQLKPDWEKSLAINENSQHLISNHRTLYLRHIALKRKRRRSGGAVRIWQDLFKFATGSAQFKIILGEILHLPEPNNASIKFHLHLGCHLVGEVQDERQLTWGVYLIEEDNFPQWK